MGLMNPPCLQIRLSALPFASLDRIVRLGPRFVLPQGRECVARGHQARRAPLTHKRPPA